MKAAIISMRSESSEWTLEAMQKYFTKVDDLDIRKIDIKISGQAQEILYDGSPLGHYDCIYAKGSFRYAQLLQTLTSLLEKTCYMPLSAGAFTIAHDKLLTHLELQKHRIPMPRTYITATVPAAKKVLESMRYPVMMKFPHGTGGKGVMFADSYASASSLLDALHALRQPFVLQEYVDTGGTDLRIIVVGNRVVASMRRKAAFMEARANFHSGGSGEAVELNYTTKKIAVDVARAIKADICAVDVLESAKGPLVIEANISPGLQLISQVTKVDVADIIAKFLHEKSTLMSESKSSAQTSQILGDVDKSEEKRLITNLSFKGSSILLPEVITRATDFEPDHTFEITYDKKKINIKKMDID